MSIIIIPDVHGRTFWKEAVKGHENDKIIFLGDYLDPYPFEWEEGINYKKDSIANFKEILDFKKSHMDNVILLQGNHDCEYSFSTYVCDCRRDRQNYEEIQTLFRENAKLFKICHKELINNKTFWFSHSGIKRHWVDEWYEDNNVTEENLIDILNNDFEINCQSEYPDETIYMQKIASCSYYRGGYDLDSSLIWCDVREFAAQSRPYNTYQIFGHTLSEKPIVTTNWAMLDARQAFILNDNGEITDLKNNIIETYKV